MILTLRGKNIKKVLKEVLMFIFMKKLKESVLLVVDVYQLNFRYNLTKKLFRIVCLKILRYQTMNTSHKTNSMLDVL